MVATIDNKKLPFWDLNTEPEQDKAFEDKHEDLLLNLAKAVTTAALKSPDDFQRLIYYCASVFEQGYEILKKEHGTKDS